MAFLKLQPQQSFFSWKAVCQNIDFDTPPASCWGLQQNLCHNALKKEHGKKYEIGFARKTRVFTFQTYTFFTGTCISFKPYTLRV